MTDAAIYMLWLGICCSFFIGVFVGTVCTIIKLNH